MHSLFLWLFLPLLVGKGLCVPDNQLEMVQWEQMEGDGTTANDWAQGQKQTWSSSIPLGLADGEALTYNGLKDIVQKQFNYVYAQPGQSNAQACMVAAYYEPNSRTVYSSSVPYGGRKRVMQLTAARDAPVWYSTVNSMPLSHPPWHAEDGAYYTYEVTTDQKPTGPKYNVGSMVAAYGFRFPGDQIGPQPLCGALPKRNPSCQQVAGLLGIAQTQPIPVPAPDPTDQEDEIDMDDGLSDSELTALADQLCPLPGQAPNNVAPKQRRRSIHGRGLERRVSGSTCISVNVQSSVPAEKLDSPLSASDIASASSSSIHSPSTTPPMTTPPMTAPPSGQPSPKIPITPLSNCEWENDPDEDGPPGCGCDGYTGMLPALPGTDSCAYTAVPASIGPLTTADTTLNPTKPFWCTSTDLANGIIAAYAEEGLVPGFAGVQCTGANSPISTLPPVPSSTVLVGNDSLNVGKTFGDPLYSGLSSLLVSACPTGGSCDNSPSKWKIGDVTTYDALDKGEQKDSGNIVMTIVGSSYTPQLLPALIVRAASAVNNSAQGNVMCTTYDTCTEASERTDEPCNFKDMFCRATDSVVVITQEEGSGNGQIVAYLEIELAYDQNSDPFNADICDLVVGVVDAGLQLLGPELEPADVAAAGEVGAICREGQDLAENVQSIIAIATGTG